jgi:hypothetical protein
MLQSGWADWIFTWVWPFCRFELNGASNGGTVNHADDQSLQLALPASDCFVRDSARVALFEHNRLFVFRVLFRNQSQCVMCPLKWESFTDCWFENVQ